MGDEVFATGLAIAPFVIMLIRKVMFKVTKQQKIDSTLPEEDKREILKRNLTNKANFWKSTDIVCLGLELGMFLIGRVYIGDIPWFLIIGYFYCSNKKKLEKF